MKTDKREKETKMTAQSTLSKNIRYFRKKKGLTQLGLAEMLYIAPQTVSKWESGLSEPDAERLCMLADIFEVSLDSLLRSTESASRQAFVAVDGGGTKTDFVLFLESGEIIKRVTLEGCNPNVVGTARSVEIIADGIEKLISKDVHIAAAFAGIAGAGSGNNKSAMQTELKARYPFMKIRVDSDLYNVINMVKNTDKCIAAISGTGSCVCGFDGERLHKTGGWGYLFDEAGSGFDIGRDAIRHCLSVEEGECEATELYRAVCNTLGGSALDNLDKIYARGKDYIASFAPMVFDQYRAGEKTACAIIKKTVFRLAELVNRLYERHACGKTVILAGGITSKRDVIEPLLREKLNTGLTLVFPEMTQIYGAAVMCMKLYGTNYNADQFELNFQKYINK